MLGIDVLELRRIDDGNVINCGGVIDCGSALIDVLELEWWGIHGGGDGGGELDCSGIAVAAKYKLEYSIPRSGSAAAPADADPPPMKEENLDQMLRDGYKPAAKAA